MRAGAFVLLRLDLADEGRFAVVRIGLSAVLAFFAPIALSALLFPCFLALFSGSLAALP
ncbi:MAG: hypothetical protein GDA47_01110 [Rhodospirillales bacterium]|nr:hypothetical protein [Rhodospirillales bacterium]